MTERIFVPGLLTNLKKSARRAMELDPSISRRDALEGCVSWVAVETSSELRPGRSTSELRPLMEQLMKDTLHRRPLTEEQRKVAVLITTDKIKHG
jgi:hypothetical protein